MAMLPLAEEFPLEMSVMLEIALQKSERKSKTLFLAWVRNDVLFFQAIERLT